MGIPKFTKFKLKRDIEGAEEVDTNIFYNGDFKIIGTIENTVSITKLSAKISGKEVAVAGASVTSPTSGVKITKVPGEDKKFTFEPLILKKRPTPSRLPLQVLRDSPRLRLAILLMI